MKKWKQWIAVALSAMMCGTAFPSAAYADVVKRNAAAPSVGSTSSDASASSVSDAGTDSESVSIDDLQPDTDAPAATGTFGYTEEEARATAEQLYSFEQNSVKKEIDVAYLMASIWYDPENLFVGKNGETYLKLYKGSPGNYQRAYLEALDGLLFFSSPVVLFLPEHSGGLFVAVQTNGRFTEQQAYDNYVTIRQFIDEIIEVQGAVSGMDEADKAKYICDWVADHLTYDTTYQKNSLGDAIRSGVTACVGYNSMTELLFEHCGLPYISIVASAIGTDIDHILGLAKVQGSWLVFDTTNYDLDDGTRSVYWIFSDRYREGKYYTDMKLVEEAPADEDNADNAR